MIRFLKNLFKKEARNHTKGITTTYSSEITTSYEELANAGLLRGNKPQKLYKKASASLIEIYNNPIVTSSPLFVKIGFILNCIVYDINVDWNLVNKIIFKDKEEYDYNIDVPERFTSVEQLFELRSNIYLASSDKKPYYTAIYKSCGDRFALNYGKISFFISRGLKVPKRCMECRKNGTY